MQSSAYNRLLAWQKKMIRGPLFLGIPERWYERPTWACENGHASHMYLKSEMEGPLCLECHKPIIIVPPESTDAILSNIVREPIRSAPPNEDQT